METKLIGIIIAVVVLLGLGANTLRLANALDATKGDLVRTKGILEDRTQVLEELKEQGERAQERIRKSTQRVQALVSQNQTQMAKLRKESIPQDCNKAIEFAIEHKGDLQW
jgi:membrane protein involved in colicin uptake